MHIHRCNAAMPAIDGVSRQAEAILATANQPLARGRCAQEPCLAGKREIARTTIAGTAIGKREMLDIDPEPLVQPQARSLKLGKGFLRHQ